MWMIIVMPHLHALACKKGGLVSFRHNESIDKLVNMAGKALTPTNPGFNPVASRRVRRMLRPKTLLVRRKRNRRPQAKRNAVI
jgi:hypothetical protein